MENNRSNIWQIQKICLPLQPLKKTRAFSSAGLEHLPYKQRVGGSNPSTPTNPCESCNTEVLQDFFCAFVILSVNFADMSNIMLNFVP